MKSDGSPNHYKMKQNIQTEHDIKYIVITMYMHVKNTCREVKFPLTFSFKNVKEFSRFV